MYLQKKKTDEIGKHYQMPVLNTREENVEPVDPFLKGLPKAFIVEQS